MMGHEVRIRELVTIDVRIEVLMGHEREGRNLVTTYVLNPGLAAPDPDPTSPDPPRTWRNLSASKITEADDPPECGGGVLAAAADAAAHV